MNPPANWYPDPTGRHGQRYWDGEQWTEHVFTDGVQGVDPLDAADGAAEQAADGGTQAELAETEGDAGAEEPVATESGGLFADAGDATAEAGDATGPADAGEQAAWTPDDDGSSTEDDEGDVAPEVQPEDVVGNLDDVTTEGPSADAAAAEEVVGERGGGEGADDMAVTDATADGTGDQQTDGAPQGQTPPSGDFSDAFMVTPETVSRLVSRKASTEPQPAEEAPPAVEDTAATAPSDEAPATVPADTPVTPPGDEAQPTPVAEDTAADGATTGAIDAPPPSVPAADTGQEQSATGLGISGDLVGGAFEEREDAGPVALQNSRLLRCSLGDGAGVIARQGTMVAYQGDVSFERQGAGGVTRALKRAATGEGLAMMRADGRGDVFFADGAQHVFLLHLDGGPGLSVNGRNVLAFSAALQWDIERVKGATLLAGGLFNTTLTGTGWVALVSDGEPVVLRTDEAPTYVDVNALVAWSGGLTTRITNTVSAKSLVGLGSGEAFQMAFDGAGIVVVQPSEGPTGGASAT